MNAREVALTCLIDLSQSNASISSVVDKSFDRYQLDNREQRFANALVYGVVRWQKQLDWVLEHFVNPRFQLDIRHRSILRIGAFQLLHFDGIPPRAAIFETVQLSKKSKKTAGFINAVLRSIQRKKTELSYPSLKTHPIKHISVCQSYPEWLVKRWIQTRGIEWTHAFCEASNKIAPLSVRTNTLITDREKLCEALNAEGFSTQIGKYAPEAILIGNQSIGTNVAESSPKKHGRVKEILSRADVYVQDESAMLIPYLLLSDETKFVVDLCAAPGGKTTHISTLMKRTGKLIATDISDEKLALLKENCQRLRVQNVETKTIDATNADLSFINTADAILIDAPCSGFGTLRRHPDIRWNKTEGQLHNLTKLQSRILCNAAQHIKKGGILVYSTCSIEQSENEVIVNQFMKNFPMFAIEPAGNYLPNIPGTAITKEGFLQTLPHEHGVDGTFAARLRRVS